jgi:hypothetical protein
MARKPGVKTELGATKMIRRTLTYDDMTRRLLVVLGHGNESRGVRTAARLAYALRNTIPARPYFTPSKTTGSPDAPQPPAAASPAPAPRPAVASLQPQPAVLPDVPPA